MSKIIFSQVLVLFFAERRASEIYSTKNQNSSSWMLSPDRIVMLGLGIPEMLQSVLSVFMGEWVGENKLTNYFSKGRQQ